MRVVVVNNYDSTVPSCSILENVSSEEAQAYAKDYNSKYTNGGEYYAVVYPDIKKQEENNNEDQT